jgi:hypothetical protein
MGAVAWAMRRRSVSHPRSSNRTCGFPASACRFRRHARGERLVGRAGAILCQLTLWSSRRKRPRPSLSDSCPPSVDDAPRSRTSYAAFLVGSFRDTRLFQQHRPQGDIGGTVHSIRSSARMRRDSGTSSPSALAVFRLTSSSNLLGSSTGRSAGLVPLRIRPT